MARFFQTTRPEFVDNFLYQPPWELAMSTLAKKEGDIQNQVDTMELLRNLPIDYHNVDRENAMRIKDSYANQIDSLAQDMQTNLLNPNNKVALKNLQRDIQRSYEFGDINKIQQNAANFRNWTAKLEQLNPYEREVYKSAMMKNYTDNNPQGALSGLFTPEEMYNSRNLLNEFAEYASKNIKDDSISKAFDRVNGQWIISEKASNSGVTREKINNAFRGWINSQADLPGYFSNREKYFGENYFNPDKSLAFDTQGSTLNNLLRSTDSLSYNKQATEQSMAVNPYAMEQVRFNNDMVKMDKQFGQQVALARLKGELGSGRGKTENDGVSTGSTVHQGLINASGILQKQKSDLAKQIKNTLGLKGQVTKSANLEDDYLFTLITRNKDKYPDLYKKVNSLQNSLQKNLSASWKSYEDIVGKKEVDNIRKDVERHFSGNTKFHVGMLDGKSVGQNKVSLNKLAKDNPNNKIELVKESAVPVSMGTNRMVDDYLRYTLKIEDADGNFKEDRYIYVPMSEVSSNYTAPGFAGATDETIDRILSGER